MLERRFDGLTPDEVDAQLDAVPAAGSTPVAAGAADWLTKHGGPDLDGDPGRPGSVHQRRTLTAARTLAETLGSALTVAQAAGRLGISRSRISHRLAAGTLFAFTIAGRRMLPTWQLTPGGGTLPGLPAVVAAIPAHLHPLALQAFMTTPRVDFDGASPAGWLASGGDPGPVVDWLTGLDRE